MYSRGTAPILHNIHCPLGVQPQDGNMWDCNTMYTSCIYNVHWIVSGYPFLVCITITMSHHIAPPSLHWSHLIATSMSRMKVVLSGFASSSPSWSRSSPRGIHVVAASCTLQCDIVRVWHSAMYIVQCTLYIGLILEQDIVIAVSVLTSTRILYDTMKAEIYKISIVFL